MLRASHAAGADPRALFQSVEATGLFRKQDIADRSALQSRSEPEARIEHRRHILEAVHRDIDRSIVQRFLQFLDENALVESSLGLRDICQRDIRAAVARGGDDISPDFRFRKFRAKQALGSSCLHQGEFAAARANRDYSSGHRSCPPLHAAQLHETQGKGLPSEKISFLPAPQPSSDDLALRGSRCGWLASFPAKRYQCFS